MKQVWTVIKTLFQRHPTDSRFRMLQGCLAGICGLLCLGLSTRLVWPDERLVLIIGTGVIWLLTSLERFLPRYHPWIVAGRSVIAGGIVLTLLVIAFVSR